MGQRAEYLGILALRKERKKNESGRTVKGVVGESRGCKGSHKKGDFKEEVNCIRCCRTSRKEGDQETMNGFSGLEGKRLENSQVV